MVTSTAREAQLRDAFAELGSGDLRPIITSLNGDNSWLWSFPRPSAERESTGKAYYHIVFEPWLNGPTTQFSSWLIHITLGEAPTATCGADVEAIARQIEKAASNKTDASGSGKIDEAEPFLDAIFMGFHYLDHLHEPTLRTFDQRIPVVASVEAAKILRGFNHFDTIRVMSDVGADLKTWNAPELHSGGFPSWLTPLRMPGHHELNYCFTLIWTHENSPGNEVHEAIFQSPHGTRLNRGPLQTFLDAQPAVENLALFHGLKESRAAGDKNTYGAEGGLALYRKLGGTKFWVLTHDSPLQYTGIVMRMVCVRDTPRTLEWALQKEDGKEQALSSPAQPNLIRVQNGEILMLK